MFITHHDYVFQNFWVFKPPVLNHFLFENLAKFIRICIVLIFFVSGLSAELGNSVDSPVSSVIFLHMTAKSLRVWSHKWLQLNKDLSLIFQLLKHSFHKPSFIFYKTAGHRIWSKSRHPASDKFPSSQVWREAVPKISAKWVPCIKYSEASPLYPYGLTT